MVSALIATIASIYVILQHHRGRSLRDLSGRLFTVYDSERGEFYIIVTIQSVTADSKLPEQGKKKKKDKCLEAWFSFLSIQYQPIINNWMQSYGRRTNISKTICDGA